MGGVAREMGQSVSTLTLLVRCRAFVAAPAILMKWRIARSQASLSIIRSPAVRNATIDPLPILKGMPNCFWCV